MAGEGRELYISALKHKLLGTVTYYGLWCVVCYLTTSAWSFMAGSCASYLWLEVLCLYY